MVAFTTGLVALLGALPWALAATTELKVVPIPSSYTSGSTTVCLSSSFSISITGSNVPGDVQSAIKRTQDAVKATSHLYLSTTRGSEFVTTGACSSTLDSLVISYASGATVNSILSDATTAVDNRTALEEYALTVPAGGKATLSSKASLGILRGLATFQQLFFVTPDKKTIYTPNAPLQINDKPEFPWRSVMLDTSRHYFSVASILKQLDAMSLVKLSVFHWHITDAQSWPMKLDKYPELSAGAYSSGEIYAQADIKAIIKYAGERGIDVVIEVDTPAHTTSIAASHPDYIACQGKTSPSYSNEPPTGQLRFANDTVTSFAAGLFSALADVVSSKYLGTGGDELNARCMNEDAATAAILKAKGWSLDNALDHFTNATHGAIHAKGRTATVWQEMVLSHTLTTVAKDTLVYIWISSGDAKAVVNKGYRIIHAASDTFYLDCGQGGWFNGDLNSWCDPFKSWYRMLQFNPYASLTADQHKLVLGGQVSLWTEQTDETNLEPLIWPRAAALAELFWTGGGSTGFPRKAAESLARMQDVRYRLVDSGIRAVPIQPHWCALRNGQC